MFFGARINSAAAAAGARIERVRSREQLELLGAAEPPALVIVDLNSSTLDPLEVIRFLKSTSAVARVPIVGFVSHVQTDLIRQARAEGCDHVLPRSAFAQKVGEIVAGVFPGASPAS
jgi:CheY-like chemotaxis protein